VKTYFIEPGDWESATGECLPSDSHGISVVTLEEHERLRNALKNILRHQETIGGPLSRVSAVTRIAERALEGECSESK